MAEKKQSVESELTARGTSPGAATRTARKQRRQRWPRIVLWCAGGLFALVVVAAVSFVLWLRAAEKAALPVLDGDVRLAGLNAPVTVRRDGHGVPHIEAASEEDLWLAQGYVTAQDRLWQMDAFRRNANGELAEVMGSSLVQHDRWQRVLGIRRTAERIWANSPVDQKARFQAYARGVNLYISQHEDALPAEFRLLGYKPRPWTGPDSISVGLMMVQTLDTHWEDKLSREAISAKLNNSKLEADLYPVGSWRDHPPTGEKIDMSQPQPAPAKHSTDDDDEEDSSQAKNRGHGSGVRQAAEKNPGIEVLKGHDFSRATNAPKSTRASAPEGRSSNPSGLSPLSATSRADDLTLIAEDLRGLREAGLNGCAECAYGSNNWVVAGSHTASGKPLLSNDMHLGLAEPNIWFMADLKAPGFHATGVTLPGVPFVIEGHNEHVAWGFTALYADVQDLYIEKVQGSNYEGNDAAWHPLKVNHETIKVRGGADVQLDVKETEHGPLLNPILPKETRAIALKWTLYDPSLNTLPVYEMNKAANWGEFEGALKLWSWPTQNLVYADDQEHIAYHAIGKVPIREGGAGILYMPVPHFVTDQRYEWGQVPGLKELPIYVPFDALPHAFDPPSGFLATANSNVLKVPNTDLRAHFPFTSDMTAIPLTAEWAEPYRAERIYKLLNGRNGLTRADMLAVQTDIYSEVDQEIGHRLAYAIDHTDGVDERLKKAADVMRSWDGRLTTDSVAASIVTNARLAFWPLILEPKLGKDLASEYRWAESDFAEEEIIMHGGPDSVSVSHSAWLPTGYKNWDALLTDAVRKGMEAGHAPGDVAAWSYGSWHVVDIEHPLARLLPLIGRMAGTGEQPLSGDKTTVKQVGRDFGPSQRFTMDWSDVDGSTENIVLGESGDPYSPYYRDEWNDYYGGTTFALPFSNAAVTAQTRHTLRLMP